MKKFIIVFLLMVACDSYHSSAIAHDDPPGDGIKLFLNQTVLLEFDMLSNGNYSGATGKCVGIDKTGVALKMVSGRILFVQWSRITNLSMN